MRHFPLMVVRVTVMAAIVAVLLVTASFFLWNGSKTIVSTHASGVNVAAQGVQKDHAAIPRRGGEEDQRPTKRIGAKPATILGLMMMLGAQQGR